MSANRWLACAALGLGALAAVAGTPWRSTRGQIDVDALASMVVHEQDHVDALTLATWIKDRKPGLRFVDVRTATEFDADHVPTAEHVPLEMLSRTHFALTDTVVMYSQGGAHAAQGWVLLRALAIRQVFFLSGGLDEWTSDVMDPLLPDDATPAEKSAFATTSAISRYFGGRPHVGPRVPGGSSTSAKSTAALKRRGC